MATIVTTEKIDFIRATEGNIAGLQVPFILYKVEEKFDVYYRDYQFVYTPVVISNVEFNNEGWYSMLSYIDSYGNSIVASVKDNLFIQKDY